MEWGLVWIRVGLKFLLSKLIKWHIEKQGPQLMTATKYDFHYLFIQKWCHLQVVLSNHLSVQQTENGSKGLKELDCPFTSWLEESDG